ncbi:MAG: T9SS type A sorting domain-containing protein [Ignavibacteria bacterium]
MRYKFILITIFLLSSYLYSQIIPQINIPLNVSDGFRSKTLYFGLDPSATNGIDTHLDEMEQPPIPPSGIFDARFVGYDINIPELGEGVLKDYRNGSDTTKGQYTHELRYQVGSGTTITISWNFPSGVSGLLQDFFGGAVVNKNMNGKDSLVVTNPGILNKLKMVITYNLTGQLPPSPSNLISPANGSINVVTSPVLKWTQVSGVSNYHLQVATDSNFSSLVLNDSTIQTNEKLVQLQPQKKYYWRVRSKNNAGWSLFSQVWSFTTKSNPPSQPILNSPPKGASGISIPVEFKWFSSSGAENYSLIVNEDSTFTNPVLNETVFDTFYVASSLLPNKTYYWKVIANNFSGSSASSEIWYFTTLTTNVEDDISLPDKFIVYQNFPNPFNSSTNISYRLPADSQIKFFLYDIQGKEIFNLDLGNQKKGFHHFKLDFSKLNDKNLTGGIFFYKLATNKFSEVKKMVYLK